MSKLTNLFQKQTVELSSGTISDFKIECDALSNEDWECLAYLISKKLKFGNVVSVPTGGDKFASCLQKYITEGPVLICDDVLTTGNSMEKARVEGSIGVVVFSRGNCPEWITPIFQM